MKIKNRLILPLIVFITIIQLVSCGVDRWPEYAKETARDQWIDSVMRENYLWYYTIPKSSSLNYFTAPSTFLQSILYKAEDNQYSYVDTLYYQPLPSYGFNYQLQKGTENDTAYYALVNYVLPNSPASAAGLERSNWIITVNNEVITSKNATKLLGTDDAMLLEIGKYETVPATEEDGVASWTVVKTGTADVSAARSVVNNPIHYYTTITTATGVKLGYLVYSKFESGTLTNSDVYTKQLLEVSNYFANEGVTHFALDLRYNSGGSFDCSQLMATLLAPTEALGTTYATLTYNNKLSEKDGSILYDRQLISGGSNLNIRQGFVMTSSQTSASIAGVFLNCISPLKRWALVGTSLTCCGMTTEQFINPTFNWAVNPIVCYVANSEDETGQGGSFTPNVAVSETSNLATFLPFGDPNETLLKAVIDMIDGVTE